MARYRLISARPLHGGRRVTFAKKKNPLPTGKFLKVEKARVNKNGTIDLVVRGKNAVPGYTPESVRKTKKRMKRKGGFESADRTLKLLRRGQGGAKPKRKFKAKTKRKRNAGKGGAWKEFYVLSHQMGVVSGPHPTRKEAQERARLVRDGKVITGTRKKRKSRNTAKRNAKRYTVALVGKGEKLIEAIAADTEKDVKRIIGAFKARGLHLGRTIRIHDLEKMTSKELHF